jgi:hypothetical protein
MNSKPSSPSLKVIFCFSETSTVPIAFVSIFTLTTPSDVVNPPLHCHEIICLDGKRSIPRNPSRAH